MTAKRITQILLALVVGVALALPAFPQDMNSGQEPSAQQQSKPTPATPEQQEPQEQPATTQEQPATTTPQAGAQNMPAKTEALPVGKKEKINGVIVRRDPDSFVLREDNGRDLLVKLNNSTKVQERKSNPFRGARHYEMTQLLRGLPVEVEGRADSSGALVANKILFTRNEFEVAQSVESRVTPVEGRMNSAETRLSESEQNAQRLSGQIAELNAVANTAKGGARAAQQTADQAIAGVNTTNQRISEIDDYAPERSVTIRFKVNSAVLSPEAMAQLDELANQAKTEKGYVIQVEGFASSDGSKNFNRRLSMRRADAVVRYLAENHDVPLRRIITPFGFGDAKPVADNSNRQGRQENRRVEVTILVSKGLTAATENPSGTTSANTGKNPQ